MPLPNLLIVGAQKSGTTWLHRALKRSAHFGANERFKELNYFVRDDYCEALEEYAAQFPDDTSLRYRFESSPAYFTLPEGEMDVAARIASILPDIETLAVLRNPVDRYLSAYTHHMMKRRFPYQEVITDMLPDHAMLSFGRYGEILRHWRQHMPRIRVYFYDDLNADQTGFLTGVMSDLGVERDIPDRKLNFRANAKDRKVKDMAWDRMPVMSNDLKARLSDYYAQDVALLETLTGRDLQHWLAHSVSGKA